MHQREGVNEFYRAGRSVQNILGDTKRMACCVDERGPVTFAGTDAGITHCLMKQRGGDCGVRDQTFKALIDALSPFWPVVVQSRGLIHEPSSSEDLS